ncbi:MAG: MogA/MoaB family molybdenum cofactor biosynthesis protein [Planctomycetales bacterium]|nr:MogA/MoaB family molybdenum cofactor biosynthesis protein [Planctomycetales bacterium]
MSSQSTTEHRAAAPKQLRFAVLTVSDTRTFENDRSGNSIIDHMQVAGHELLHRSIVPDEPNEIAGHVQAIVDVNDLDVLLITGGTGISPRDQTLEAVGPLFEMQLPGFGELFRMLSYEEIGPAAMLSRAAAGRIGRVLVFCMPGSTAAVNLAMQKLLVPELPHLVHHSRG